MIDDYNKFELYISGKDPEFPLPRRGYYIAIDDQDVKKLRKLPYVGTPNAEWFRVSGFPGMEPASYKTNCGNLRKGVVQRR